MIKRNRYSVEFKKQVAMELTMGQTNLGAVSKREGITATTLARWRDKYGAGVEQVTSDVDKVEILELRNKLAHYEAALGELALENHILKKFQEFVQKQRKRNSLSKPTSPSILESKKAARWSK